MIEIGNLSVRINGKLLLDNISFDLARGQILCLLGKNGSGKSTLLRTILGNLDYTGSCKIKSIENSTLCERKRAQMMSYVPQNQHIIFPFTLFEVVLMGKFAKSTLFAYTKAQKDEASAILEKFNISHLAKRLFYSLSMKEDSGFEELVKDYLGYSKTQEDLDKGAKALRAKFWALQKPLGAVNVGDFTFYDNVWDTLSLLGEKVRRKKHAVA